MSLNLSGITLTYSFHFVFTFLLPVYLVQLMAIVTFRGFPTELGTTLERIFITGYVIF